MNCVDRKGSTPLHGAAAKGHTNACCLLLGRGAVPNLKESLSGRTPFHVALLKGHEELSEVLVAAGASIHIHDAGGSTPLRYAVVSGSERAVRQLLENGADANVRAKDSYSPFAQAVALAQHYTVDLLLEFGADVNRAIRYARTPIFVLICGLSGYQKPRQLSELPQAAMESGLKVDESSQLIARTLMKHGVDVNGRDDIGKSPLWYAVSRGFTTVVEELLRDPGVRQDLERTYGPPESSKTVVEAAISGKGEHYPRYHMVKVLLEAGADRNRTRRFRTPLSQAISLGYIELLKLLMLPECINLQLDHGSTALFVTVGAGYIETTRYLLSMRADPNI